MPGEESILNIIARRIRSLRGGMTQRDFAGLLDVSPQAVSDWENAVKMPRIGAIERLSKLYGVPKSYILGDGADDPPQSANPPVPPAAPAINPKAVPIIDSIERNSEAFEQLTPEEIISIAQQMEFTIQYVKNKRKAENRE